MDSNQHLRAEDMQLPRGCYYVHATTRGAKEAGYRRDKAPEHARWVVLADGETLYRRVKGELTEPALYEEAVRAKLGLGRPERAGQGG
jgi:hypothetical protein